MPCHWNFPENLKTVLKAVGGDLYPEKPLITCGRYNSFISDRPQLERVCEILKNYCKQTGSLGEFEPVLSGDFSPEKKWLAASLEKTIRLQMDPPCDIQEISDTEGPGWIYT